MRLNFITTSRADFSILIPLICIIDQGGYEYRTLTFGEQHSKFVTEELSYRNLKAEVLPFPFADKPRDNREIVQSLASLSDSLLKIELKADLDCIIVVGDRYELIPLISSCFMLDLTVIHFCGGDRTSGSKDDSIRDVISNLSTYHFVTNIQSLENLKKYNIQPQKIINVGHIPLQGITTVNIDLNSLSSQLNIATSAQNILVTLHPDTTKSFDYNQKLVENTFTALNTVCNDEHTVLVTGSNADEDAVYMENKIREYIKNRKKFYFINNLGVDNFRKVLACFDLFIGNSSSIFYEAPEFPIVSVNIGDRQKGRLLNPSILEAKNSLTDIIKKTQRGLEMFPNSVENLYKNTNCLNEIISQLKRLGVLDD